MILLELYRLCGFWGIGSLFTLNITEIAKFEIGRLRPHFIAACGITLNEALCFEPLNFPNLTQPNVTEESGRFEGSGGSELQTVVEPFVQEYTQIYKVARSFCNRELSVRNLISKRSELYGIWTLTVSKRFEPFMESLTVHMYLHWKHEEFLEWEGNSYGSIHC